MSKGLEELEKIKNNNFSGQTFRNHEEDYIIIEKSLKALEIIKEKEVNVRSFKNACSEMSYEQYFFMWTDGHFMGIMLTSKTMLAQEEYKLLKEVLL